MATIAEQLTSLANTKTAIKQAIVDKGVAVADDTPFSGYAAKIGEISGGAPATKFGLTLDDVLGTIDENGTLQYPQNTIELNLAGLKSFGNATFQNKVNGALVTKIIANDLTYVSANCFKEAFKGAALDEARFDGLEEVSTQDAFSNAFALNKVETPVYSFAKLTKISGYGAFSYAFSNPKQHMPDDFFDKTFPVLEEISNGNCLTNCTTPANKFLFSKLKKITGFTASYGPCMGGYNKPVYLPSVTEITGYVFNTLTTEIHFAAANQAAIEACSGYDMKWGATNATLYFDL